MWLFGKLLKEGEVEYFDLTGEEGFFKYQISVIIILDLQLRYLPENNTLGFKESLAMAL